MDVFCLAWALQLNGYHDHGPLRTGRLESWLAQPTWSDVMRRLCSRRKLFSTLERVHSVIRGIEGLALVSYGTRNLGIT